jgi:hypothetical protein
MKRLILVSILAVIMLPIVGFRSPVHAQSPGADLKPTFISPTPGLYINGWPRFTVSYPKEWVEAPAGGWTVFSVAVPRPNLPHVYVLAIGVQPSSLPLEEWAKIWMQFFLTTGRDIKVLSDRPSQLKDGTPTREVEIEWVITTSPLLGRMKEGFKANAFILGAKKDLAWVWIFLQNNSGRVGEDLKKHAHSLTFLQGREEPVQVPPDIRAFLSMFCSDVASRDVEAIMGHFSDRFLYSFNSKTAMERTFRNDPIPLQAGCEPVVTIFEPQGDRAYVDGFFVEKTKGLAKGQKIPMLFQQIINEHGQWKWFGNQK